MSLLASSGRGLVAVAQEAHRALLGAGAASPGGGGGAGSRRHSRHGRGPPRKPRPQKATLLCGYVTPTRRGRGRRAAHPALSSGPADVQAFQQGQVCRHGPQSAPHLLAPDSPAGHLPVASADWTHSPAGLPAKAPGHRIGKSPVIPAREAAGSVPGGGHAVPPPAGCPHRRAATAAETHTVFSRKTLARCGEMGIADGKCILPKAQALSPRPRLPGGHLPQPAFPASDGLRPHRVSGPSLV